MPKPVTTQIEKASTPGRHPILLKIPDPKFLEIKYLAEDKGLTPTTFCMMLIYEQLKNYQISA